MSVMETKRMMIEYATDLLKSQAKIKAAWLMGSYGRGDNDAYSDFDVCAYVPLSADAHETFKQIERIIRQNPSIVFSKTLPQGRTVNAITEDWERLDITVIDDARISAMSLDEAKFMFGQSLAEPMMKQDAGSEISFDKVDAQATVNEFVRVLGLLPVVVGRNDCVLGQSGAQLLRDMLIKLMMLENASPIYRGVLSMRKSLTAEQYSTLQNIPPISADKDELLNIYKYIADQFFIRGQRLSDQRGIVWPARFIAATRRLLESQVGIVI